jgi:hypothetical protein
MLKSKQSIENCKRKKYSIDVLGIQEKLLERKGAKKYTTCSNLWRKERTLIA